MIWSSTIASKTTLSRHWKFDKWRISLQTRRIRRKRNILTNLPVLPRFPKKISPCWSSISHGLPLYAITSGFWDIQASLRDDLCRGFFNFIVFKLRFCNFKLSSFMLKVDFLSILQTEKYWYSKPDNQQAAEQRVENVSRCRAWYSSCLQLPLLSEQLARLVYQHSLLLPRQLIKRRLPPPPPPPPPTPPDWNPKW